MPTACILQKGAQIRLKSERLEVWMIPEGGTVAQCLRNIPLHDIERLILKEGSQISSEALCALLRADIPISLEG